MTSIQAYRHVDHAKEMKVALSELGRETVRLLTMGSSYLLTLALRITATVFSLFGQCGKSVARSLRVKAKKIYAIHVYHNELPSSAPLPLLACAKNIARRDCIRNGEDVAAFKALRAQILKQADPEIAKKLQAADFKGARTGGICNGATFWFLKSVAPVTSEKELLAIAKRFEEGFPAEAAGLQSVYKKHRKIMLQNEKQKVSHAVKEKFKELEKLENREEIEKKRKECVAFLYASLDSAEKKSDDLTPFAALMELRCQRREKFNNFERDASVRKQYDQLPKGNYYLSFNTSTYSHAIAYLKFDFGSYLYDPNKGLMKGASSAELMKLLARYPLGAKARREVRADCYANSSPAA